MQVRRDVRLADLTTLAVGGPIERLLEVTDAAELVAAVRDADEAGRPLLRARRRLQRGRAGRGLARRRRRRPDAGGSSAPATPLTVQAGEDWDDLVAYTVENGLAGIEALSGHPGLDGRDAGPERRRLRPGGRPDDHRRPRVRPRGEVRAHADPGRVRLRLPRQPAQARPRPVRRPRRHVRACSRSAVSRPVGYAELARDARRRARRHGAAGRRPRGGPRAAPRQGHGPRPGRSRQPQRRARSSPTRSSRRRRPSTAARAGPPATGMVKLSAAWLVAARRLRPRHAGRARRDVVAPQPRADDRARRDGGRAARLRRPHRRGRRGAVRRHPASASPPRSGPSSPARPCAGRPGRAGGRPSGRCSRGAAG